MFCESCKMRDRLVEGDFYCEECNEAKCEDCIVCCEHCDLELCENCVNDFEVCPQCKNSLD